MRATATPFALIAVALAALAGFVDAYAFVRLGGFFVSFMSGNTTQGGAGWGQGDFQTARLAIMLVIAFVSGVMGASILSRFAGARFPAAAMALTTLFLLAAALSALLLPAMVLPLLALAMGAENGVFARDGEVTIGVTYMTGTLVRFAQSLTAALMGERPRWLWLRFLALWLGFFGGASGGAIAERAVGDAALWYAALAAAWITLILTRLTRDMPRHDPLVRGGATGAIG